MCILWKTVAYGKQSGESAKRFPTEKESSPGGGVRDKLRGRVGPVLWADTY